MKMNMKLSKRGVTLVYDGYRVITDEELAHLYEGSLKIPPNEYLVVGGKAYRSDGKPLSFNKLKDFSPKNLEQRMAFDLLDNDEIPIKFLYGIAGSGKTKMAIQYGLSKLGKYDSLFIVRHPVTVGESLGLYKGTKEEKIKNWINPIVDNVEGGEYAIERMQGQGKTPKIEFDVPGDMQGRDLRNRFIIVDEAQQLTREQIKMIGSRVSTGSVIVFCGDIEQTFENKYKGDKNGLGWAVEMLRNEKEVGIVQLKHSVRGRVAELFASMKI